MGAPPGSRDCCPPLHGAGGDPAARPASAAAFLLDDGVEVRAVDAGGSTAAGASPPPVARLVISEASWKPRGPRGDWVELANLGAAPAPLAGVRLTDRPDRPGLVFEGPCAELALPPGGRLVLERATEGEAAGKAAGAGAGAAAAARCRSLPFGLSDGEALQLFDAGGSLLSELEWAPGQVPEGLSFGLPAELVPEGAGASVLAEPTPGGRNAPALALSPRFGTPLVVPGGGGPPGRHPPSLLGRAIPFSGPRLRSNLPLAVLKPSRREVPNSPAIPALLWVSGCDGPPGDGSACALDDRPAVAAWAETELRGRSSQRHDKKQYKLEIKGGPPGGAGGAEDAEEALLGMPAHEDWILAADHVDRSLGRNWVAFELSRRAGRWAPRQRFVELFQWRPPRDGGGAEGSWLGDPGARKPLDDGDYLGVYALREAVGRGAQRVDLPKYRPGGGDSASASGVSGAASFLLEFKSSEHEGMFSRSVDRGGHVMDLGPSRVYLKYPKRAKVSAADEEWLRSFLRDLEERLSSRPDADDPRGYAEAVDLGSLVDYFLHTELTKNLDGYISSLFLRVDRGEGGAGQLSAGPVWDYDLAFGNTNNWGGYYRGADGGWVAEGPNQREYGRVNQWFERLMRRDEAFRRRARARWEELRAGPWSQGAVEEIFRALRDELGRGPAERNFERWPMRSISSNHRYITLPWSPGSWEAEVAQLETWLRARLRWMDAQTRRW